MTPTTTTLLDHVRALVEAERGLTEALEQTLPLLNSFNSSSVIPPSSSSKRGAEPPLLPAPHSSADVPTILAVARSYSLRTSAPPAWNTNLPVVGFATPNPLPHQLRGGALGAMQLNLAREEKKRKRKELLEEEQQRERELRRKRVLEEEEQAKEMAMLTKNANGENNIDNSITAMDVDDDGTKSTKINDPKRQEMMERQRMQMMQQQTSSMSRSSGGQSAAAGEQAKKVAVSMNLSDSSSSGEEGSDDDDDDDDDE